VNATLLNEFLKEHPKNEEQEATIAELEAEIGTLSATVKAQAVQIQKVSAKLELSNATQQTVLNNAKRYHSLKSPLYSSVSITLPAAS
jgi:multidrug resistance efflux pump